VMIFSIVLLVDVLLARREQSVAGVVIALYCLISIIEFLPVSRFNATFAFARLWIELLLWEVFLFCLWPRREDRKLADPLRVVSLCAVVLVVWSLGAVGYHRHFAHLDQEMSRRIPRSEQPYLASEPRPTPAGFVYTAMLPEGYRALDQFGRKVWLGGKGDNRADQLTVAAAKNTPGLLLEFADSTGSRIVAIPSGRILITNAESPAISSDGRSVAFIRETKGRGTLWVSRLDHPLSAYQIAGDAYDVRDAAFAPSGLIMFGAKVNGRISIFSMIPGDEPRLFSSPDEDVDSPAVSPDERLVAFRKLVNSRWQLGYLNMGTGEEKMLTVADCNAYSPVWAAPLRIAYATDCGRGLGLSGLASVSIEQVHPLPTGPSSSSP
jgi:WD40-like Beta Propeller Repeat